MPSPYYRLFIRFNTSSVYIVYILVRKPTYKYLNLTLFHIAISIYTLKLQN